MPILEIEIVLPPGKTIKVDLASSLANLIGQVFNSPPGRTWVRLKSLPADQYSENDVEIWTENQAIQGDQIAPVFVTVLKSHPTEGNELQEEVKALTRVIAETCGRPAENVHILYLPPASGRIAFGGKILDEAE